MHSTTSSSTPATPVRCRTKLSDNERPVSPSPSTSGFSLIGAEEASEYNLWTYNTSSRRAAVYSTPTLNYFSSPSSLSSSSPPPGPSPSWQINSSPSGGLRGLFPRLWDVLVSSPTKNILSPSPRRPIRQQQYSIYGTYPRTKRRCSSENMLPFPIQRSTSYPDPDLSSPIARPVHPSPQPTHRPSLTSISSQSSYSSSTYSHINYSDLPPLDGEEGELVDVDDEACFLPSRNSVYGSGVNYLGGSYTFTCRYNCKFSCNHPMGWKPKQSFSRARVVTGIDIVGTLPVELALEVLMYIASCEVAWSYADDGLRTSGEALDDVFTCMSVSKTWRALAMDNSLWRLLFEGRWSNGVGRGVTKDEGRIKRYLRRERRTRGRDYVEKRLPPIPGYSEDHSQTDLSSPTLDYFLLYRDRLELEKRWAGTAFTKRVITPSFLYPPPTVSRSSSSSSDTYTPYSNATSTASSTAPSAYNSAPSSPSTTTILPLPSNADSQLASISEQYLNVSLSRNPFYQQSLHSASLVPNCSMIEGVNRRGMLVEEQWEKFEPGVVRLEGHTDSVYCVEFTSVMSLSVPPYSPSWDPILEDDEHILTGSRDRTIKMWSLRTGRCVGTFGGASSTSNPFADKDEPVEGHSGSVLCLKFFWSDDSYKDADGASKGKGKGKGKEGLQFKPRRGVVYSGSSDRTICVWDIWTEPEPQVQDWTAPPPAGYGYIVKARVRTVLRGHGGGVLDLRVDDRWIVSCSKDAAIRIWLRSSVEKVSASSLNSDGPAHYLTLRGHEGPVNAVGLENGLVVSASGDGKMILWDVESGEKIRTFEGHDRGLACIAFKDNLIISGSNDCKIKIWSAITGECLRTLDGHDGLVRTLAFDPHTGLLVSASYDKSVRVWDVREVCGGKKVKEGMGEARQLRQFKNAHTSHIFDVKFDARRIVSTSHDQKIVISDFSRGLDAAELFV
uniref:F-box domain-containing protein n=1 Tax=Moniliophthora roreri TaxID=221103 RepID=A0A0W0FZI4_MONRR